MELWEQRGRKLQELQEVGVIVRAAGLKVAGVGVVKSEEAKERLVLKQSQVYKENNLVYNLNYKKIPGCTREDT